MFIKERVSPTPVLVGEYTSILKDHRIFVFHSPINKLLSAVVVHFDALKKVFEESAHLPLKGVPSDLIAINDSSVYKKYFRHVYMVPLKGDKGDVQSISVRVALKGGVQAKIPFQPGLALGCIIRGETLDKLDDYAKALSKMEDIEGQFAAIEQQTEKLAAKVSNRIEVVLKADDLKNVKVKTSVLNYIASGRDKDKKDVNGFSDKDLDLFDKTDKDTLLSLYALEGKRIKAALENLQKYVEKQIEEQEGLGIPGFATFERAMETPIDLDRSKESVAKLGFDTVHFTSQYFDMDSEVASLSDRSNDTSKGGKASVSGSHWFVSGGASGGGSKAISERLTRIKNSGESSGVLVISAVYTTKNVRQMGRIVYDREKLRALVQAMQNNDPSSKELSKHGISQSTRNDYDQLRKDLSEKLQTKEIKSKIVGLLKKSFDGDVPKFSEDSSENEICDFLLRKVKDGSLQEEKLKKDYSLDLKITSVKSIYLLTQAVMGGSFTAFVSFTKKNRQEREAEIKKEHEDMNFKAELSLKSGFSNLKVEGEYSQSSDKQTQEDKMEASRSTNYSIDFIAQGSLPKFVRDKFEVEIAKETRINPEDKKQVINAIREIGKEQKTINLHSMESVLKAFDDHSGQMSSDEYAGVPIGYNYRVLTQDVLERYLNELDGKKTITPSTNSVDSKPGLAKNEMLPKNPRPIEGASPKNETPPENSPPIQDSKEGGEQEEDTSAWQSVFKTS